MMTLADALREEGKVEGKEEGRQEGRKEGRIEGKREGKKEGVKAVALEMLRKGSSVLFVAEVTHMDINEVEKLKKKV